MKTYVNFTRFQTLLYYLASFIGLAPFTVKNNNLRPNGLWRKAFAVILIVLSLLWTYLVFLKVRSNGTKTISYDFVYKIYVTLYASNVCSILFIFAFESNKIVDIINKITAIKDELKKLGIDEDSGKNRKNFFARIIVSNAVILLMKIIINITLKDHAYATGFVTIFWIGSITTIIQSHNAILIFVEIIICISKLFESLNNKLQSAFQPNCNFLLSRDMQDSSAFTVGRSQRVANEATYRFNIHNHCGNIRLSVVDVESIAKLHEELCILVESTTQIYTVPILLDILQHFVRLLSNCYSMYTHMAGSRNAFETTNTMGPFVQQLVTRTTIMIVELLLITHSCTSMCNAGNATKVMLHEIWSKFYPEELMKEFYKFSLQLLHRPVVVAAFGFFRLDYSCLYQIFWATVAHSIIMIQLDTSQQNPSTYLGDEYRNEIYSARPRN